MKPVKNSTVGQYVTFTYKDHSLSHCWVCGVPLHGTVYMCANCWSERTPEETVGASDALSFLSAHRSEKITRCCVRRI